MGQVDVLVVVPPFANAAYPALGSSILATACRERGVNARVFYASFRWAARIGFQLYQRISVSSPEHLCGEALFSSNAFVEEAVGDGQTIIERLFEGHRGIASFNGPDLKKEELLRARGNVEGFLRECTAELLSCSPKIVGFSSVFQQHLASIALAKALKRVAPTVCTVLGGGNAAPPMGHATADLTDAFDFVFSGEADVAFPQFCEALLMRQEVPVERVIVCDPIHDMDRVVAPCYDDYYEQLKNHVQSGAFPPNLPEVLPYESSRGCWYGAKHHCKFCGLNKIEALRAFEWVVFSVEAAETA
jgi:hypothetical protein